MFGAALAVLDITLHAVRPRHGCDVVTGYREALDAALREPGPVLVGGVSLGAHVAAAWAAGRAPGTGPAGLLLALPAWTGPAGDAPAALAARLTAGTVRAAGVDGAVRAARQGTPPWLAAELERAWTGYGPGLADALEAAAAEPGPDPAALRSLAVPTGLAALVDDPVHPLAEAQRWRELLPRAALRTTSLAAFGADPAVLGRAAVLGWREAASG